MADITENEISVLLKRTRSTQTGEEHETIAYKPQRGETVAHMVQRILTSPGWQPGDIVRAHNQTLEIRLIKDDEAR